VRECGLEPLQFNWFRAAARLYNALTHLAKAIAPLLEKNSTSWHATELTVWWLLVIPYSICYGWSDKERLLKCEPIDLGRFLVDLRERYLDYWAPCNDTHLQECNSKHSTYNQWCALPSKRALVTRLPQFLPRHFLTFLRTLPAADLRLRMWECGIILLIWTLRKATTNLHLIILGLSLPKVSPFP